MKKEYLSLILLVERLHRRFLDVIKSELDRNGIEDINNVQTLILYNIGELTLTVGELTNRGYYLGSNVSYNVKKLVEKGFIIQQKSQYDKRSIKVKLSEKGLELCKKIDNLYQKNIEDLEQSGVSEEKLVSVLDSLRSLENLWSDSLSGDSL